VKRFITFIADNDYLCGQIEEDQMRGTYSMQVTDKKRKLRLQLGILREEGHFKWLGEVRK
jgi:hypothetical protein